MALSTRTRRYLVSGLADDAAADEIADAIDVGTVLSAAEVAFLDGAVAGTATASKADVRSSGGDLALPAGFDTTFDTTTGSKIGGAANQKIGKWGVTPVVQPSSADQTAITDSTGGSVADAIAAVVTAPTALTDNGGGTADATVQAQSTFAASVGWNGSSVYPSAADEAALTAIALAASNNMKEVTTTLAAVRLAIVALTNGLAKNIELTNAIRAALVLSGEIKGSA